MAQQPDHITIVYHEAPNKPTPPIAGAWGGATPDGSSVVANVYSEGGTVPSIQTYPLNEGRIDLEGEDTIKRADLTREVLATLVFSPEAALRVGRWLQDKARIAMDIRRRGDRSAE